MTLEEIKNEIEGEVVVGHEKLSIELKTAFAADLMSDVLAFARSGCLLITGLTTAQSVRTAFALDIAAIIICRGFTVRAYYSALAVSALARWKIIADLATVAVVT